MIVPAGNPDLPTNCPARRFIRAWENTTVPSLGANAYQVFTPLGKALRAWLARDANIESPHNVANILFMPKILRWYDWAKAGFAAVEEDRVCCFYLAAHNTTYFPGDGRRLLQHAARLADKRDVTLYFLICHGRESRWLMRMGYQAPMPERLAAAADTDEVIAFVRKPGAGRLSNWDHEWSRLAEEHATKSMGRLLHWCSLMSDDRLAETDAGKRQIEEATEELRKLSEIS